MAVPCAFATQQAKDPPFKKDYPQDGVYWAKSWYSAFEEAKLRNVPVLYVILDDGLAGCDEMLKVCADRRVIEASRSWVNIAANPQDKHLIETDIDGKRVRTCERFWNVRCSSHVEGFAYTMRFKQVESLPLTLFVKEGFMELGRVAGKVNATKLVDEMRFVLGKWPGNRLTADEWKDVKPVLDEGDRLFNEGHWRKSIDTYSKLKNRSPDRTKELAEASLLKVNGQGVMQFIEACKMETKGRARADALKRLRQIVKDFKPLPCSVSAEQRIQRLENDDNPTK